MKVQIRKMVESAEVIEVDLPFYYKTDLGPDSDNISYYKIDKNEYWQITIDKPISGTGPTVEIKKRRIMTSLPSVSLYLSIHESSNVEEYEQARAEALKLIQAA